MGKITYPDEFTPNGTLHPKDFHTQKGFGLGALTAEVRPF